MTLLELIQKAIDGAVYGLDNPAARLTAEVAAEALVGPAFQDAGEQCARVERLRSLLRRTKLVAFVNGAATLDDDVLTAYVSESSLLNPLDKTKRYSWVPWETFVKNSDLRLGTYSIEVGTTIHSTEPQSSYDPAGGPTVSLLLTIPCAPVVPAAIGDTIVAPVEVTDDIQLRLTTMLRLAIVK